MKPRVSVIIATAGRGGLDRTVESAAWSDETIVVFNEWGDWGMKARNLAMAWASGTHLAFMDDDDWYTDNAETLIRSALGREPDRIHVFAMSTVDATGSLAIGFVGTPMFIVPNVPNKLGHWREEYCGDNAFINETAALQGRPVFHPGQCIAVIKGRLPDK